MMYGSPNIYLRTPEEQAWIDAVQWIERKYAPPEPEPAVTFDWDWPSASYTRPHWDDDDYCDC